MDEFGNILLIALVLTAIWMIFSSGTDKRIVDLVESPLDAHDPITRLMENWLEATIVFVILIFALSYLGFFFQ